MKHHGEYFQWHALPFGLNIAPYEWQRLMLPIPSNMRRRGIMPWCYLDDWIVLGRCRAEALRNTRVLVDLLLSLGLEINYPKSLLVPTQQIIWIGFELDFRRGMIRVPQDKMQSILKDLDRLRRAPVASIH